MRNAMLVLWMLVCSITSAAAQVSVGIGFPGVSIGINLPVYPELVRVPGYPVYYAPQMNSNYFFYDGMYWVYQQDNWYASSWYNGPWGLVAPEAVPLFVLRVPVRYYRQPPVYFRGWRSDAPPRWGEHWGGTWEQRRRGWDNWNHSSVPAPAPLPLYQRQYSGNRYPPVEQQQVLQSRNYRYQPRDAVVQQHYQGQQAQSAPAPSQQVRQGTPRERNIPQQEQRSSGPPPALQQGAAPPPHAPQPPRRGADVQRPTASQAPPQQGGPTAKPEKLQAQQGMAQRQQQTPKARGEEQGQHQAQAKAAAQEATQGQDKGRKRGEKEDGERNK